MTIQNLRFKNNFPSSKFQVPSSKKGFTLLETLVALTVLTIGITASLTLIGQGLKSASYFHNQTTAFYLAIEGIEFTKNRVYGNFLWCQNQIPQPSDCWLTGLNDCQSNDGCYINVAPDGGQNYISPCGAVCPYIKYDSSANIYNYSAGAINTIFARKITISDITGTSDEKNVSSEISWQDRYGGHNFKLETHIFNWY